ncbi:hypothetical protein [Maribacter sp.]|uniref:hypothetical protein n=1 Tax=Maribacter sp. TaxID=1897614 RepID=UPI0025BAE7FD|nr:hypothetical protein [Maribacter sp.]
MKNTVIITFFAIIFSILGIQELQSQYRQYKPLDYDEFENGERIDLYRYRPIIRSGYTSCCTEESPFNHTITFNNMGGLLAMQNAINAAQWKKVEAWLRKQENNFKNEINRQLGTKHTSFRDAQKAFYKNYEENVLKLNDKIHSLGFGHIKKSNALNEEQKQYTNELVVIEDWKNLRNHCRPIGIIDCGNRPNTTIRGKRIGSMSIGALNSMESTALKDFYRTEYESALQKSWGQGVYRINDNNALTTEMVNKHINYYNSRGLQDKVFLMTAYLTQYNNRYSGVLAVPISKYNIPPFWKNSTLLERGKKKTSTPMAANIFKPNFDRECRNSGPTSPRGAEIGGNQRCHGIKLWRERIIQKHKDEFLSDSELGMTLKLNRIRDGYRSYNGSGKIGGLDALAYSNYVLDGTGSNANRFYQLTNGGWVYRSNSPREDINGGNSFSEPSLNDDGYYYYMHNDATKEWHEVLLPAVGVNTTGDAYLVNVFWNVIAKNVGRYALPVEDAMALVDAKDLDGKEYSRAEASIWLVIGLVPGGKILKPVGKVAKGAVVVSKIIKIGDKTIIRVIIKASDQVLGKYKNFANIDVVNKIKESLTSGAQFLDEVEDASEIIEDLSKLRGRKLTWEEVKRLFKRGNDFNRKGWKNYDFNEINLLDKKRLDSYIPGKEIISRKATTLSEIKAATFEKYLKELTTKYKVGKIIDSSKLPKNTKLSGQYYLEIPLSNKSFFENSITFKNLAKKYNVKIKYLAE